jgi:hypothetical protein
LEEVETGQHTEWEYIADCSPMYKSYWAQWKSRAVTSGISQCLWESTDGQSKIAQIILSQSRVNNVLNKPHGGLSGGHLSVNKTLYKVWQRYYRLQARNNAEKWCQQCDTCAASSGP